MNHPLGEWPMMNIFAWIADNEDEGDFTKKDILSGSGVRPIAMRTDFPKMIECGMVEVTRKIGGVELFQVNKSCQASLILMDLIDEVIGSADEDGLDD